MAGEMRKPFYVRSRKCWYVWHAGRQLRLDADETTAYALWQDLIQAADPGSVTAPVAALAEAYLRHLDRRVREGSITDASLTNYGRHLVAFCKVLGQRPVRQLRRNDLTQYLAEKRWSPHKQRTAISVLKAMMQWGVDEELLPRNPFARYPRPKVEPRSHLISQAVHRQMIQATDLGRESQARAAAFRPILIALRHSGRRTGDICQVMVEDTGPGTWTIHNHKTRHKTGSSQTVYLSPCLATLTEAAKMGRSSGVLFRNHLGQAWTPNAIQRRFRRLRERLDLPAGTMAHAYRHTYITQALVNGVDVQTVAELVGHTDSAMIQQVYGHLAQKRAHLADAARRAASNGMD